MLSGKTELMIVVFSSLVAFSVRKHRNRTLNVNSFGVSRTLLCTLDNIQIKLYRPPNRTEKEYIEAFNSSSTRIMSNNMLMLWFGDFNCGYNEGSTMQVPEGVSQRRVQSQLLEIVHDHYLSHVVNIHIREDKTLDRLLTHYPSPVNGVNTLIPTVPEKVRR